MKARNKGKRLNKYLEDYIIFDLETTGVDQEVDDIIEISAVKVRSHEIKAKYSTLVDPGRPIPAGATAVNGITDAMVKDAPDLKTAMEGFLEFVGDDVLVGHNIHTFDTNFVYDAVLEVLGKEFTNDYVDTLFMARNCLPELPHHRLTDVASHFGVETAGAHRALSDCIMNQKCYEELGKILKQREEEGAEADELACPRCGGVLIKRKGRYGAFYGCSSFPQCRYTRNIPEGIS